MLVEIFGSLGTMTLLDFFLAWVVVVGPGCILTIQFYSYSLFQNCPKHITTDGFFEMALFLNDLYILVR